MELVATFPTLKVVDNEAIDPVAQKH